LQLTGYIELTGQFHTTIFTFVWGADRMEFLKVAFSFLFFLQFSYATRRGRLFSIFSVVAFPNDECTTETNSVRGVCFSEDDCGTKGGTASGTCASGFGVCCLFKVSDCTTTINQNVTYIQNTGYPSSYSITSKTCSYTVSGSADICQIRLDFDTVVLDQPSSTGTCSDEFSVDSPASADPPTMCGTFSGTHMYVETGRSSTAAKVTIKTSTGSAVRYWNIKTTLIDCFNPIRAPTDCLQYYTTTSGEIKSFNFGSGLMTNLRYDVCIRESVGYCSFEVHQTSSSPDGFYLGTSSTAAALGSNCAAAYVMIGTNAISDRYCGGELNPEDGNTSAGSIISDITPFRIRVSTTGSQVDGGGFDLSYVQRGCGQGA